MTPCKQMTAHRLFYWLDEIYIYVRYDDKQDMCIVRPIAVLWTTPKREWVARNCGEVPFKPDCPVTPLSAIDFNIA